MTTWHDVGSLSDLERDGRLLARIDGREVGVVVVDGEPHGVRNRCPHHGGPLCLGTVVSRVRGEPGGYALGEGQVLRCPWHGWEFDPVTGACLDDPSVRVAVYPAEVSNGRVLIDL
jgi:nitrite reductase/ring-hydroxylating ferredoxin subunit